MFVDLVQPSICAIRSIPLLLLLLKFLLFDGFGICKERLEESAGAFLGCPAGHFLEAPSSSELLNPFQLQKSLEAVLAEAV